MTIISITAYSCQRFDRKYSCEVWEIVENSRDAGCFHITCAYVWICFLLYILYIFILHVLISLSLFTWYSAFLEQIVLQKRFTIYTYNSILYGNVKR